MCHSGTQRNHFEYLVLSKAQYIYVFNPSLDGVGSKTSSRLIFRHNNCIRYYLVPSIRRRLLSTSARNLQSVI